MRVSLLTFGVAEARGLDATYKSLLDQQNPPDWEWLIGVPQGATIRIPESITKDSRVHIIDEKAANLHTALADRAFGALLVSLPPSTSLTRFALDTLVKQHDAHPQSVIFPDFAVQPRNPAGQGGLSNPAFAADSSWWWHTFDFEADGRKLMGCSAAPLVPALVGYNVAGSLPWAVPSRYGMLIPELLVKAVTGEVAAVNRIGTTTHILPAGLNPTGVLIWMAGLQDSPAVSDRMKRRVLETCRAWQKKHQLLSIQGTVTKPADNIDLRINPFWFLNNENEQGWPQLARMDADSVGLVTLTDFLPFMPGPTAVKLMQELHRVMRHGAILQVVVPTTRGQAAFENPAYRSWWNERTFEAFTVASQAVRAGNKTARFVPVWQLTGAPDTDAQAADMTYLDLGFSAIKTDEYPAPRRI